MSGNPQIKQEYEAIILKEFIKREPIDEPIDEPQELNFDNDHNDVPSTNSR
jgi:hypothetical protein